MPEDTGSETRKKAREKDEKVVQMPRGRRESEDTMMDVTNGRAQLPPIQAQIPSTLTQVYLTVLGIFLSRDPDKRGRKDAPKTMTLQQR